MKISQSRTLPMITNCSNGTQIHFSMTTKYVSNLQFMSLINIPIKVNKWYISEAIYFLGNACTERYKTKTNHDEIVLNFHAKIIIPT